MPNRREWALILMSAGFIFKLLEGFEPNHFELACVWASCYLLWMDGIKYAYNQRNG